MTSFKDRVAASLDHPIDAACGVRPPGLIWIAAIIGVLLGYLVAWLRLRGTERSVAMALVLTPDRVELHRLAFITPKATGLIRAIPYDGIRAVDARSRLFELRVDIATDEGTLSFDGAKRGSGAAPPVVEELRRRIAA